MIDSCEAVRLHPDAALKRATRGRCLICVHHLYWFPSLISISCTVDVMKANTLVKTVVIYMFEREKHIVLPLMPVIPKHDRQV